MLLLGVSVRIRLVLLLGVLRAAPRVMPFLAADVASIGPHSAHIGVLFPTFGALRVTIDVPLVSPIVSLLGEISLLTLVVEISLALVLPELPGTLRSIASLGLWSGLRVLTRLHRLC